MDRVPPVALVRRGGVARFPRVDEHHVREGVERVSLSSVGIRFARSIVEHADLVFLKRLEPGHALLDGAIARLESYLHMADFGTCAIDWPLMDEWDRELAEGKLPV